ncbi:unnamed protein product, partial [Mesorhabditis spiculigera]
MLQVMPSEAIEEPPSALISFEEFTKMPHDVWLLIMDLLNPVDLLHLAYSDSYFKELVTASPKRWGLIKAQLNPSFLDARTYKFIDLGNYVGPAKLAKKKKYLLGYGDEYAFKRYMSGVRKELAGFCRHVPPDVDREPAALDDLFILLNNAVFDLFGYGVDWNLPDPSKYRTAPHVRAHIALMSINGPKLELCRQIAALEPMGIAIHTSTANQLGPVISEVAMLMPVGPAGGQDQT